MTIQKNTPLQALNTFGIEAHAAFFTEVVSEVDLLELLQNQAYSQMPKLILGGGSNLLFTKDFEGLVIKIGIEGIEKIKEDDTYIWVKAGAGVVWHDFVLHCIEQNWAGLENLSLIYGTVGAAPMQNIGAYGVEIKDVFDSLETIEISTGAKRIFKHQDCNFGYRESIFKHQEKGKHIITSVTFKLNKSSKLNIEYGAIRDTLAEMGIQHPSIQEVSRAVIHIRQSKLPNPAEIGNAGSFFKNPEIRKSQFDALKANFPTMPSYPVSENQVKVPAGWLIEQAGWKGKRFGEVGVHAKQALVLVNYGGGKGEDIKKLSQKIQESVYQQFGITLKPEVNFC